MILKEKAINYLPLLLLWVAICCLVRQECHEKVMQLKQVEHTHNAAEPHLDHHHHRGSHNQDKELG